MQITEQRRLARVQKRGSLPLKQALADGKLPIRVAADLSLLTGYKQVRTVAYILALQKSVQ